METCEVCKRKAENLYRFQVGPWRCMKCIRRECKDGYSPKGRPLKCENCGSKEYGRLSERGCDLCAFIIPGRKGLSKTMLAAQEKLGDRFRLVPPNENTGAIGGIFDTKPHLPPGAK